MQVRWEEEGCVVTQGGLAEVQHLLYKCSPSTSMYLKLVSTLFPVFSHLSSGRNHHPSPFSVWSTVTLGSEDVTVTPVCKVVPSYPDDVTVIVRGLLHGALLQGGELQSRGGPAGQREVAGGEGVCRA